MKLRFGFAGGFGLLAVVVERQVLRISTVKSAVAALNGGFEQLTAIFSLAGFEIPNLTLVENAVALFESEDFFVSYRYRPPVHVR